MPTPFFADMVRALCNEGRTGSLTPSGAVPGQRRFAGAEPVAGCFPYTIAGAAGRSRGRCAAVPTAGRWRGRGSNGRERASGATAAGGTRWRCDAAACLGMVRVGNNQVRRGWDGSGALKRPLSSSPAKGSGSERCELAR